MVAIIIITILSSYFYGPIIHINTNIHTCVQTQNAYFAVNIIDVLVLFTLLLIYLVINCSACSLPI